MSDTAAVSGLFLFRRVDARALHELCILAPPVDFPAGVTLFEQGAKSDVALLLVSGALDVEVEGAGARRTVGKVNPGEIVGETALFAKAGVRNATVRAIQPSQCLLLNREVLERGNQNPAIVAIEQHLLATLARRIRRTNQEITKIWKEQETAEPAPDASGSLVDKLKSLFGGDR